MALGPSHRGGTLVTLANRTPERGDVIQLQFDPQADGEAGKSGPALVISPLVYNRISKLLVVCPIASRQQGWPFEVLLPDSMETYGVVLVDQIRTVDCIARQAQFIEPASPELVLEVISRLETLVT
ncbi:MAG: type II toxin-antitoxin system PemK/MazF family toxin [Cyanobacteria bacterium P01_D01_bin.115]